jgi:hypothetical protein
MVVVLRICQLKKLSFLVYQESLWGIDVSLIGLNTTLNAEGTSSWQLLERINQA